MRWFVIAAGLAACGGGKDATDSGTPAGNGGGNGVAVIECTDAFSACGGDVVGSWSVDSICDPGIDTADLGCPQATYEVTADRSSGTVVIEAGGTYDRTYDYDVDVDLTVPKSCLYGMGCDLLVGMSQGLISSCTDTGTDCDCTGNFTDTDVASGTWTVSGNILTTDGTDDHEFCINGNTADVWHEDDVRAIWVR